MAEEGKEFTNAGKIWEKNQGKKKKTEKEEVKGNASKEAKEKDHEMAEQKEIKNTGKIREKNKKRKKKKKPDREEAEVKENKTEEPKDGKEEGNKVKNSQEERQPQLTSNNHYMNKRKRKDVFPFGNYRSYYGYRIGQDMEEDPRLKVLKREWFQAKDCLDIGCNSGIITIQIARKFLCRSILGIDIDRDRIADAYWHLRKFVRAERAGKPSKNVSQLAIAEKVNCSEHSATVLSVERKEIERDGSTSERDLFDVVSFQQENFVHSWRPLEKLEKQYDTILCLSVTKWVHLNWGDDGLITLFSKIWKLLRPGGILVLEPQPWKSYEKNRLVSETTAMNYRTIMFHPADFQEILLDKIGFRLVEDITSGLTGSKTGFDRPIFAFYK